MLATPYIGRINGLSTPASSAFHRRARVVSGELVDSPYDPFANDRKGDGHNRKRQRMSWGSESRWTVNGDAPSPSKKAARYDWIRDEDLQSPAKRKEPASPITPTSPSLEEQPPSDLPAATDSQIRVAKEAYTQELVNMVSGDTEEEDFPQLLDDQKQDEIEDEDEMAVTNAFSGHQELGAGKFAVFRDTSLQLSSIVPQRYRARTPRTPERIENPMEAHLHRDEELFDLLPSDSVVSDADQVLPVGQGIGTTGQQYQLPIEQAAKVTPQHTPSRPPQTLRMSDMPPPILPSLQTSGFTAATFESMPPPPPSALIGSPRTPDLRPQQSWALPIPSPFPGEELSSYMDVTTQASQNSSVLTPRADSSPLLPDWMLQVGFGFGSQGFMRDSHPKQTQYAADSTPFVEEELPSQLQMDLTSAQVSREKVAIAQEDELDITPAHSRTYAASSAETISKELIEPDLPWQQPSRKSNPPQLSTVEVIVLSGDRSDSLGQAEATPDEFNHGMDAEVADAAVEATELEADDLYNMTSQSEEDEESSEEERAEVEETEREEQNEVEGQIDGEIDIQNQLVKAKDLLEIPELPQDGQDSISSNDLAQDELPIELAVPESLISTLPSATAAGSPRPSALKRPIVIDLMDSDISSEDEAPQVYGQVAAPDVQEQPTLNSIDEDTGHETLPEPQHIKETVQSSQVSSSPVALNKSSSTPQPKTQEVGVLYEPIMHTQPLVSFEPRVTRRRAALEAQSAAEFEPHSAPLASSQQFFQPPKLKIQDTFEGIGHSGGSVTTASPSRGSDLSRPSEVEEEAPEGSPKSIQSPWLETYDGAMEFIASSPPILPAENVEASYRREPPLIDFKTVPSHFQPFETVPQSILDGHFLVTPEASQQLSQQPILPQQLTHQDLTLPPTPHLTQSTTDQSFYNTSEVLEAPALPPDSILIQPEISDIKGTPLKASFEFHSDGASSVLNPWFGIKSSLKSELEGKTKEYEESATQGTATQVADEIAQEYTHVDESERVIADTHETAKVGAEELGTPVGVLEPDGTAATQRIVEFSSQLPPISDFSFTQSQAAQAPGLLTSTSYYTPLSNLFACIRIPSNSQGYNDNCVDVIAVVSKATTKALRADSGPRDYHTTLSITDELFYPRSLRAQVFRPWRAALPKAEKGDIILLRGFEVFSAKGNVGVGLKSGENAAWCVWHFSDVVSQDAYSTFTGGTEAEGKPWTKRRQPKQRQIVDMVDKEEMRGPPVEFGEEEKEYVMSLREWWEGVEQGTQQSEAELLSQGLDSEVIVG
jgi:hypothetical protein